MEGIGHTGTEIRQEEFLAVSWQILLEPGGGHRFQRHVLVEVLLLPRVVEIESNRLRAIVSPPAKIFDCCVFEGKAASGQHSNVAHF